MNLKWHKKWECYGDKWVLVLWRDLACHMELRFTGETKKAALAKAKEYIDSLNTFTQGLK